MLLGAPGAHVSVASDADPDKLWHDLDTVFALCRASSVLGASVCAVVMFPQCCNTTIDFFAKVGPVAWTHPSPSFRLSEEALLVPDLARTTLPDSGTLGAPLGFANARHVVAPD